MASSAVTFDDPSFVFDSTLCLFGFVDDSDILFDDPSRLFDDGQIDTAGTLVLHAWLHTPKDCVFILTSQNVSVCHNYPSVVAEGPDLLQD